MAEIVGIHGIAQEYDGRFSMEQIWLASVRNGLAAAEHHQLAEKLADKQLRVAFFGDLFRRPGTMGGATEYPYSPLDVKPGLELDLLTELYQAASEEDDLPQGESPADPMGGGFAAVQAMVEYLLRNQTFAGIAQRAFIGSLKQVALFLSDKPTKERVIEDVHRAVQDDTKVIIGHSMGSIVAYEYLCRYQPPSVRLLITLGSPLGVRNLIFDRLTPAPVADVGVWPGSLTTWVNVADPNDCVALRKKLAALWHGSESDPTIVDREVSNGQKPHSAARYLNSKQTGAALGDALG